jgi:ribonuclease P/MRP protein subunit POP5
VKRRYLAVKAESKEPIQGKEVLDAVWNALTQLFGEYGASQSELAFIHDYKQKGYFILRCSRRALPRIKASITSITEIREKPATIHVLRVSGTLKALRKKTASGELT